MTDREFRKELEVILDGWPFVRSHLSSIISSRRLEEIDDIIESIEELVDRYLEEKRREE
jgi:hypothetical protein